MYLKSDHGKIDLGSNQATSLKEKIMAEEICISCGEQEAIHDGMCSDCLSMMSFVDTDPVVDDCGYRQCDCEDYPCCGH